MIKNTPENTTPEIFSKNRNIEIKYIEKRDGTFVPFNLEKIKIAVCSAIKSVSDEVVEVNIVLNRIMENVVDRLNLIKEINIFIEDIQDIVVSSIFDTNFKDIAIAYSSYRKLKETERDSFDNRSLKLIDEYLNNDTWEVKENANMSYSLQGLNLFLTAKMSKAYWINKLYNKNDSRHHSNGNLHIHDLGNLAAYCCGWDLKDLLDRGFTGCPGKLSCDPPKHFNAAVGQIYNFVYTTSGEVAGAVALSNVDTLLAPYIRRDNLTNKRDEVKQVIQNLIYNLNVPTRVGFQCISEDTEILTETGWKLYDAVSISENIVTMNMTSALLETLPITNLCINRHQGIMYRYVGDNIDQLVNAEHRCVIRDDATLPYKFVHAKDLYKDIYNNQSTELMPYGVVDLVDDTVITDILDENITEMTIKFDYDGIIWCPTTENDTIVCRRNGKVFITGNSPFTNFSLDLTCPEHMRCEQVLIAGENTDTCYGDYQEEIDLFNDVFCEVMIEGDRENKIFTFPIPTYGIDKNFDFDNPNLDKLWEMTGKFGIPYFGNYINTDLSKEDFTSMCPIHGSEYVLIQDINTKQTQHTKIKYLSKANEMYEVYSDGKFVKGKFQVHPNQKMLNVELSNGHTTTISQKHLNFILRNSFGENIEEIAGKDLDVGMYLPYSTQAYDSNDGSFDLGYLLGVYAGNGSINDKTEVVFSLNDTLKTDVIDNVINIAKKYFGATCHIENSDYSNSLITKANSITIKSKSVAIKSKSVVGICKDFVIGQNLFKRLSSKVFVMSVDFKKGLIDGYLATEADATKRICTASKVMVKSLNMLAASLGTITSIKEDNEVYDVLIHSDKCLSYKDEWFKRDNRIWVKIVNIKPAGVSTGYCFEVMDDEPVFTIGTTGILTHNCRLRVDVTKLKKRGGGLFGSGTLVGSLGVITINMARIGHLATDKEDFFKRLDEMLIISKDLLISKSVFIEEQTKNGLYPYSRFFLQSIYERFGKYWANHFLTIGIIGVNEACINLLDHSIEHKESYKFSIEILDFINEKLLIFQKDTEFLFNLEASPSESTSFDLWNQDKKLYPKMKCFQNTKNKCYTNSTFLPIDSKLDLFQALNHQETLQDKYTGGTVFHGYIGESLNNPKVVKDIIKLVLTKYKVPYFSITPTFSICDEHGYIRGIEEKCPTCNEPTSVYSRVVGYFRPTKNWNEGKLNEFKQRTLYDNDMNRL